MPFYHDKPHRLDPRDPAEAEFWRRLLDHGPGPLTKPVQTFEQIREELIQCKERDDHLTALTEAGFGNLAQVLLAGAVARDDEHGTASPPSSASSTAAVKVEPEHEKSLLREALLGDEQGYDVAVPVASEKKDIVCKSGTDSSAILGLSVTENALPQPAPSLVGEGSVKDEPAPRRKRRRSEDIPWWERETIDGYDVSKYISKKDRLNAIDAFFVAMALHTPFNMAIDLNPGLDHLSPIERMRYWAKIPNNVRSYIQSRLEVRKRPASWWPRINMAARESDPGTHMAEHAHWFIHVPCRDEMKRLVELVDRQRADLSLKNWCANAFAREIDAKEVWKGGKFHSALGYLLKAVDSQTRWADSTILYEPSGAVLGDRVRICRALRKPEVVMATEREVAMFKRLRDEKRIAARRRRPRPPIPWE